MFHWWLLQHLWLCNWGLLCYFKRKPFFTVTVFACFSHFSSVQRNFVFSEHLQKETDGAQTENRKRFVKAFRSFVAPAPHSSRCRQRFVSLLWCCSCGISHCLVQVCLVKCCTVCPVLHHSLQSSKLPLQATSEPELGAGSFMKWVSVAEQLHTSLTSPRTTPSVGWSCVEHAATGLWSWKHCVLFGVMIHASLSGSL